MTPPHRPEGELDRPEGELAWLDRPSTHTLLFRTLGGVCAGLLVIEGIFLVVGHPHGHFAYETWPGFHGLFGFLAYLSIVNGAKLLRRVVMRREDFYER